MTTVQVPGTETSMPVRGKVPSEALRFVPRARPYVFDPELVRKLAAGVALGMNICLTGPTGCGKSSFPISIAALLGHPLVRFNCHGETRVSSMVGLDRPVAKDGVLTLEFSARALVQAMRGGYWVLFDEIDAALPSVLFVLQSVLEEDRRSLFVPELDEEIVAAKGFQIFATGNTIGYRSIERASFAGTQPLNDAFIDRFGMVLACSYPALADEIERIRVNVPAATQFVVEAICRTASELRTDRKLSGDFSTRRCVQWARLTMALGGLDHLYSAAEHTVALKMRNPSDAQVFRETLQRVTGGGLSLPSTPHTFRRVRPNTRIIT